METLHDAWLRQEKKKIHDKYEAEREKIHDQAFLDGFTRDPYRDYGRSEREYKRSSEIDSINQREETEMTEFLKSIGEQ